MTIMLKLVKGGIKMSRKVILLVLVALLSAFVVQNATIQSVNARYIDEVPVPNSKILHKYGYFDEARNYFMPSFLAGNKGGSVVDLSSVSEKEPGVYIALKSQWWYKDDYIEPNGYVYIKTLDEKNNKYQYGFAKTSYGPDRWFDLSPVYVLDVQVIIKKAKEKGSANNNSQNTQPKVDPTTVDLMKCWQEDVDACTLEDGSMLTIYDGMPEAEVKNNFIHWQVKNYEYHPETKSSLEYISYSMERGNNQLREVLRIYKIPDQNTVVPLKILRIA